MEQLSYLSFKILAIATVAFLIFYSPRIVAWFGSLTKQKEIHNDRKCKFALLIPARDESATVEGLFRSIEEQDYTNYDVHVIVKDSKDKTVALSAAHGFTCHVVENQTCKADALDGALQTILHGNLHYDGYMIVDADCKLAPDFLSRMNDAMASDADVIVGKKLIKNHLTKGQSNLITDCNGIIWTLIDDMGNRYKSDHGITCMTVGTGLLLSGRLVEKLGGFPYKDTLTEDIELMYDCAASGYPTYYASQALCYVEESPLHDVTNKRRRRWMRGVVASRRKYKKALRRGGNGKNRYFTTCIAFSYLYFGLCTLDTVFFGAAALTYAILGNPAWKSAVLPALFGFGAIYFGFFAMTAVALFVERKNLKYSFFHTLAVLFLHPLFYMEYIAIVADAIVMKKETKGWEVIARVEDAPAESVK